jgi:hypothetical protein
MPPKKPVSADGLMLSVPIQEVFKTAFMDQKLDPILELDSAELFKWMSKANRDIDLLCKYYPEDQLKEAYDLRKEIKEKMSSPGSHEDGLKEKLENCNKKLNEASKKLDKDLLKTYMKKVIPDSISLDQSSSRGLLAKAIDGWRDFLKNNNIADCEANFKESIIVSFSEQFAISQGAYSQGADNKVIMCIMLVTMTNTFLWGGKKINERDSINTHEKFEGHMNDVAQACGFEINAEDRQDLKTIFEGLKRINLHDCFVAPQFGADKTKEMDDIKKLLSSKGFESSVVETKQQKGLLRFCADAIGMSEIFFGKEEKFFKGSGEDRLEIKISTRGWIGGKNCCEIVKGRNADIEEGIANIVQPGGACQTISLAK